MQLMVNFMLCVFLPEFLKETWLESVSHCLSIKDQQEFFAHGGHSGIQDDKSLISICVSTVILAEKS